LTAQMRKDEIAARQALGMNPILVDA